MTIETPEDVHHPVFARIYMRLTGGAEDDLRRELLGGARGEVIEVGAGHGPNFPFYPREVERVLAVEPEDVLREEARKAAADATVPVEVVEGVAGALPAADESFDVAVASLVLCSVPDQQRALSEIHRVLRPGGELRFYEHVVSRRPRVAALQRIADSTLWPKVAGGCHMARDTAAAIEAAGFEVVSRRRFGFPAVWPIPHVIGLARKPGRPGAS